MSVGGGCRDLLVHHEIEDAQVGGADSLPAHVSERFEDRQCSVETLLRVVQTAELQLQRAG
jgi:hypothetical protein